MLRSKARTRPSASPLQPVEHHDMLLPSLCRTEGGPRRLAGQARRGCQVKYVDVVSWFCTTSVCPMVVAGMVTHFDQWHVSAVYSASLAKPFAAAVGVDALK